jgi:hypothetical protein
MRYRTSAILIFLKKLWAFENRQFVWKIYEASCLGKSDTNNLPAPTDLIENPYGEKNLFLEMQLKNRPPSYYPEFYSG